MDFIIAFIQLSLFVVFLFTLKCEVSKKHSDAILLVSIRTFVMCASSVLFFMLFDIKYHNSMFLILMFILTVFGILYATFKTVSSNTIKYQKGMYNDLSRR